MSGTGPNTNDSLGVPYVHSNPLKMVHIIVNEYCLFSIPPHKEAIRKKMKHQTDDFDFFTFSEVVWTNLRRIEYSS